MKRILLLTYQIFIAVPLLLLATGLTAITTIIGCTFGDSNIWGYYPGKYWGRFFCWILMCPVKVKGYEHLAPNTSYIFVANHQGAFDIFLIYGYINRSFKWLMKKELRSNIFIGKACEAAGHVFVDNSTPTAVKQTIDEARERLQNGVSIVIFPEGARTIDGKIHRFKSGAFQLAMDLNLQVVPMTIEGPYKVMKRGTFMIYPHKMHLTIHPPIKLNPAVEHPLRDFRDCAFTIIRSGLKHK